MRRKRPPFSPTWGAERRPVSLFFILFLASVFESHQSIKTTGCISKMSPLAGQNRNFEKSSFCNFFILKVAHYMRKRRTFVRRFPCCIFHQHILVRDGRLELPTSCSQSKRATNCANPGFLVIQFCTRCGQTCGQAVFLTISACGGSACIAGVSRDCGHSIFQLEGGATRSQTRRDTNFAIPGYSISAMIPRRTVKIKFFLSVVIPVVKAAFMPLSATG